jgi:DNA-binding MarR family transcriptional regulator
MDKLDPQQTIFYSIEKAIKCYRKYAQKQLSDVVGGITIDQMLILTMIEEQPDIAQNVMAELLFKDFASITRMINLLVQNKYVSRTINDNDRRKYILKITAKGQSTLKQLKPIIFRNRNDALKGVSEQEVKQLFTTLNKIINNCL